MCGRIAEPQQEFGGADDHCAIERADELDIVHLREVSPECPQNQRGFILLDWQLLLAVSPPGMPRTAHRAVGIELVQEIAVGIDDAPAEIKKVFSQCRIASFNERCGYQRAVARPHVRVCVARELKDVRVVRGDNGAAIVKLGADDQQALPEQPQDGGRQRRAIGPDFRVAPELPVIGGSLEEFLWCFFADEPVELSDFMISRAGAHPVMGRGHAGGRQRDRDADGGIHRPLRDCVAG